MAECSFIFIGHKAFAGFVAKPDSIPGDWRKDRIYCSALVDTSIVGGRINFLWYSSYHKRWLRGEASYIAELLSRANLLHENPPISASAPVVNPAKADPTVAAPKAAKVGIFKRLFAKKPQTGANSAPAPA